MQKHSLKNKTALILSIIIIVIELVYVFCYRDYLVSRYYLWGEYLIGYALNPILYLLLGYCLFSMILNKNITTIFSTKQKRIINILVILLFVIQIFSMISACVPIGNGYTYRFGLFIVKNPIIFFVGGILLGLKDNESEIYL